MSRDPHRLPPMELLATFEAAARLSSFTRAAVERFVTQSAVSRQVKALEDDLGVRLFQRRHRALVLTDEGRALFAACSEALGRLREVASRLRAPQSPDLLTVTTTPGFASLWLIPRLAEFTAAHPKVNVRIDASYAPRDLAAESIDVAIRYGRVGHTAGRQLAGEEVMPVCSPKLLRKTGVRVRGPRDLLKLPLLGLTGGVLPGQRSPLVDWDAWFEANAVGAGPRAGEGGAGRHAVPEHATVVFSDYDDVVQAALHGQGVALGRRPLIDGLLATGRLVTPLAGRMTSPRAYFVVLSPKASERPAARAFADWLFRAVHAEAS